MTAQPRFPDLRQTDIARMACAVRPLPIALAHEFAKDTDDEHRMAVLARLYTALSDADQHRCLRALSAERAEQVRAAPLTFLNRPVFPHAVAYFDGGDETHRW